MFEDGTHWLVRETWHAATSLNVFDPSTEFSLSEAEGLRTSLVRYWYTNGRPSRMELASTSSDLQYLNSYVTWYLQYDWHGDVANSCLIRPYLSSPPGSNQSHNQHQ